jgi:hypothetical protein
VPGTEFLQDHRRIKAKRLRGVYSEGLLLPLSALGRVTYAEVGGDASGLLGITKHQDKVPDNWGTSTSVLSIPSKRGLMGHFWHWCFRDQLRTHEEDPGVPVYDIEPYKKNRHLLRKGDVVAYSEKLHGTNARYGSFNGKFYVGSRNHFWRDMANRVPLWRERFGEWVRTKVLRRPGRGPQTRSLYWKVADQYDLRTKLKKNPGIFVYGEVFGAVQDLKYGADKGQVWFRVFDIYDRNYGDWLTPGEVHTFCAIVGLDTVPLLDAGPFDEARLLELTNGQSTLANHIREGVVVKACQGPRVILKSVSEAYKLRKGGTELQ